MVLLGPFESFWVLLIHLGIFASTANINVTAIPDNKIHPPNQTNTANTANSANTVRNANTSKTASIANTANKGNTAKKSTEQIYIYEFHGSNGMAF